MQKKPSKNISLSTEQPNWQVFPVYGDICPGIEPFLQFHYKRRIKFYKSLTEEENQEQKDQENE